MDRILFGDNQFFGVNHMSEDKARAQAMRFQSTRAIVDVLDAACELGINTFMCTTHDRIGEICRHVRRHAVQYDEFQFYPCLPYAHKYANAVGQHGLLEALRRFAPGSVVGTLLQGAVSTVSRDVHRLMRLLVDAEMKMFAGVQAPVVFLQNVVTDLLLGLGMHDLLAAFHAHLRDRYDAEAGFITMNLPRLLDALESVGVENPIVCANINKIGFRMCGGVPLYEQTIAERRFRPVAMSIFASGAIEPDEAVRYVCSQPRIESILFGASTRSHIAHTKELIERYSAPRPVAGAALCADRVSV